MAPQMPPLIAGDVLDGLRDALDGKGYTGPVFDWTCGALAATRPEPHIALSREYLEDNDITVDIEYVMSLAFAAGVENGYRLARRDGDSMAAAVADKEWLSA